MQKRARQGPMSLGTDCAEGRSNVRDCLFLLPKKVPYEIKWNRTQSISPSLLESKVGGGEAGVGFTSHKASKKVGRGVTLFYHSPLPKDRCWERKWPEGLP